MYIKTIALTMLIFFNFSLYNISIADSKLSAEQQEIIKKEVRAELQKLINEEGFLDQSIERAIEIYIAKQMEKSRQQKKNSRSKKAQNVRPISTTEDHIYGDPNAPISLVEYSDFECPFCKSFHPTVKKLVSQNQGK